VRRLIIETTQHQEKTVSVEPETRILVDRREGTLEELKPGKSIRVVLPRESSKAILIEVT
jgi:pyruvoyl-dependent arginine decarboxylase (PvlArgDC)